MANSSYYLIKKEGQGVRYLCACRCKRLEQVGIVESPWEKRETKNANKTEYNHVSVMAERQSAHTAIRKENNTIYVHTKIIHQFKSPHKKCSRKCYSTRQVWQISSYRCAMDEEEEKKTHKKNILLYTPPLLSLMLEGLWRRDATVTIFHFCILIYLRCMWRKYTSILYSFPSFL